MGSEGSVVLNAGATIRTARKPATCREFADAEHIASWHPVVALAVADWMDEIVRLAEKYDFPEDASDLLCPALAVARTYLGGPS